MSTIIIDSDDYAASGIDILFFPGGELHVKIPIISADMIIPVLKLRSWMDVGFAALLLDALARQRPHAVVRPFIPYFPGARQERSDGRAPLTLEVMRQLLASRWMVHVLDFHSYSSSRPVCVEYGMEDLLPARRGNVAGIIAPDDGAMYRATRFRDALYAGRQIVHCTKKRDPHTGALSGYYLPQLHAVGHYIVVDDICDGGGTFNLLAEAFDADPIGAQSTLELVVAHGIFSKGVAKISRRYQHITTSESWCRHSLPAAISPTDSKRLTVLPLDPIINRIKIGDF
jgi:ribose-phosphate pyrophosphokinase